jgi:hypothetical protein
MHGVFLGGWNISPEASALMRPTLFRQVIGPSGNVHGLLKVYHSKSFFHLVVTGHLSDHIAVLSKSLSILLLLDPQDPSAGKLEEVFDQLLHNERRPRLFQKAFSARMVLRVRRLLANLNLNDGAQADGLWEKFEGRLKMPAYQLALAERTLLLIGVARCKDPDADPALLPGLFRFHHEHFVEGSAAARERMVCVQLTPGVARMVAILVRRVCLYGCEEHKRALSAHLDKSYLSGTARRPDFIRAVVLELSYLKQGRRCIASSMPSSVILTSRSLAFPVSFAVRDELGLRHGPNVLPSPHGYSMELSGVQALIQRKDHADLVDMQLRMMLLTGHAKGNLSVSVKNSSCLIVRANLIIRSRRDAEASSSSSLIESSGRTDETGSSSDDPDEGGDGPNAVNIATIECSSTSTFWVTPGDIVIAIVRPTATPVGLTKDELAAINWAFYGSPRETVLQIAATLPTKTLYHVVLVEKRRT